MQAPQGYQTPKLPLWILPVIWGAHVVGFVQANVPACFRAIRQAFRRVVCRYKGHRKINLTCSRCGKVINPLYDNVRQGALLHAIVDRKKRRPKLRVRHG